ncbi:MAG: hypothetical protein J5757_02005 [Lachnospiraceae bacterium]|nr:hypothetical protein [Lachnospiraceae bacterium]
MILTYKCPGCAGAMNFNESTGKMECPFCGRSETVETMQQLYLEEEAKAEAAAAAAAGQMETGHIETVNIDVGMGAVDSVAAATNIEHTDDRPHTEEESINLRVYTCSSCGGEILTDDVTAATFCSYCGNPTLIAEQLTGQKRPSRLIPFTIQKDRAIEAFRAWTHKGILTPSTFRSKTNLEKTVGIYVPFWLFDYGVLVNYQADGQIISHEIRGEYRLTHTDHYDVHRKIHAEYDMVPADASKEMDDHMMDCLEPFNYSAMKEFEMPYLSGFYAEKNSYTDEEMAPRVKTRVAQYGETHARGTIKGYANVITKGKDIRMSLKKTEYVLLPVWIINYEYKGEHYRFAMNGQTGKTVGVLPVSKAKAGIMFGSIMAVIWGLLTAFGGVF